MDFDDIKQLINSNKERVIVVENGKPVIVLISFDEYKKIFKNSGEEENKIETIPEEIRQPAEEKTKKELTIEDLPF